MLMLLYKWLLGPDLHYSVQASTQKCEFQVGEGQRMVIKKRREVEYLFHKNRIKECGWLRLEYSYDCSLYIC